MPRPALNETIGIEIAALEHSAEVPCERRLARAQKTNEEDMVAPVLRSKDATAFGSPHAPLLLARKVAKRAPLEDAEDLRIP